MSAAVQISPVAMRHPGGAGHPLVLVHGYGADRLTWSANQPVLSATSDVYSLDLPGHGSAGTDVGPAGIALFAQALAAGIEGEGLAGVDLAGHSFGGAVAARLAATRPNLVRSLVLIAPVGFGGAINHDFLQGLPRVIGPDDATPLLQQLVSRPRLINKMMVGYVLEDLAKAGRRAALAAVADALATATADMAEIYADLAAGPLPRLVIWGDSDRINGFDRDRVAAFGGQSLVLEGIGHLPHVEAAAAVNAAIRDFVAVLP